MLPPILANSITLCFLPLFYLLSPSLVVVSLPRFTPSALCTLLVPSTDVRARHTATLPCTVASSGHLGLVFLIQNTPLSPSSRYARSHSRVYCRLCKSQFE